MWKCDECGKCGNEEPCSIQHLAFIIQHKKCGNVMNVGNVEMKNCAAFNT